MTAIIVRSFYLTWLTFLDRVLGCDILWGIVYVTGIVAVQSLIAIWVIKRFWKKENNKKEWNIPIKNSIMLSVNKEQKCKVSRMKKPYKVQQAKKQNQNKVSVPTADIDIIPGHIQVAYCFSYN